MLNIDIHKIKTNFLKYLKIALQGEEIIIFRNHKPIVILKAISPKIKQRHLGAWKGKVWMADDFDSLPEDFINHFE